MAVDGAGQALVSGFLHLLHPDQYGLVNTPTKAPFIKNGWLNLSEQQRRKAREKATASFSNAKEMSTGVFRRLFRWEVFLHEVYDLCGFTDYHELDQFLWMLSTEPADDADDRLEKAVAAIRPEDLTVRIEAETKARALIDGSLGQLTSDQFSELFTLINTCFGKKGPVYTRFSPAFVGHNANLLIEQGDDLNEWIEKLWKAKYEEIPNVLSLFWEEKFSGGGRSFPTAVLYLRDKEKYAVWTANLEKALYSVVPGLPAKFRTGFSYLQFCKGVHQLRKKEPFPPEMHDFVLFKLIRQVPKTKDKPTGDFTGFTEDTFKFMGELIQNNTQEWFDSNRDRFKESVDQPLRALVKDLSEDVITPLDPDLETSPKKCLSRIKKNTYGRKDIAPYHDTYWAAFYRKEVTKNTDCQLFITIWPGYLKHGIYFGEQADSVREQLCNSIDKHPKLAEAIFDQIKLAGFLFAHGESTAEPTPVEVSTFGEFVELAKTKRFEVYRQATPDNAVNAGERLKDSVAEDLRKLYPLLRLSTEEVTVAELWKLLAVEGDDGDDGDEDTIITTADLAAATYLEEEFYETLDLYLRDKRQLIFFGPPGTGKTFVALEYAEYLSQGGGEVRTVQFHPSYGYEDFIEGLRPVASSTGALTYKVEDGIFKRLCDEARTNPKAKYVLLIDEINRGNIPRIFGELMFLLERREKKTDLPYSKKPFSIPQNVIVLGTMNSSDRSIALLDLALRRRFHFVEMQPRGEILLGWLQAQKKPKYVRELFDRLNDALRKAGIDEDRFIGHAHFMSPHLDDDYLRLIWKGTIEPLLKEYFFAEPQKLNDFRLEKFQNVIELAAAVEEDASEEDEDHEEDGGEGEDEL